MVSCHSPSDRKNSLAQRAWLVEQDILPSKTEADKLVAVSEESLWKLIHGRSKSSRNRKVADSDLGKREAQSVSLDLLNACRVGAAETQPHFSSETPIATLRSEGCESDSKQQRHSFIAMTRQQKKIKQSL